MGKKRVYETEAEYAAYRAGYHAGVRSRSRNLRDARTDLNIAVACIRGVSASCNELAIKQLDWCVELISDVAEKIYSESQGESAEGCDAPEGGTK